MLEPLTLLTGFLTMWAQLNNYGIDTEKFPHLKNVRVRREIPEYIQDYKESIIIKNIARMKRQNNMHNNFQNDMHNDYVETIIPLANYPPGSEYYSQNTAGVPYYYNAYNGNNKLYYGNNGFNGNNNGLNGNRNGVNGNNNAYNGNNNAYNNQNYQRHEMSSKLIHNRNRNNKNQANTGLNVKLYNPFPDASKMGNINNNIGNNNGLNNGNNGLHNVNNGLNNGNNGLNNGNNGLNNGNNGLNNGNSVINEGKNDTLQIASFIGSSGCPGYLKQVKLFGTSVCISDDDY